MTTNLFLSGALLLGACGGKDAERSTTPTTTTAETATAELASRSGSTATGMATFTATGVGVAVTITVRGASPGAHGLHLHEQGDCSSDDGESAGAHWNPLAHDHGQPGPDAHAGDLGNIVVGDDGTGTLELELAGRTLAGELGVVGRAVILHADPDDLSSQPGGNASSTREAPSGSRSQVLTPLTCSAFWRANEWLASTTSGVVSPVRCGKYSAHCGLATSSYSWVSRPCASSACA